MRRALNAHRVRWTLEMLAAACSGPLVFLLIDHYVPILRERGGAIAGVVGGAAFICSSFAG